MGESDKRSGAVSPRLTLAVALIAAIATIIAAWIAPQVVVNINQGGQETALAQIQPTIDSFKNASTQTPYIIEVTRVVPVPQSIEVTRVVEVTREIPLIVTTTPVPLPSATSTPIAPILFQDSFTGKWSDQWTILSGEPFITNDRLATVDTVWMTVGDQSWRNYKVEFTVYKTYGIVSNLQTLDNYVGVRFQDIRNMITYRWAANIADWATLEDGALTRIPDTTYRSSQQGFPFRVTIIVQDNAFEVANGTNFSTGKFQSGGVALRLTRDTTIDDFSVEELP